jgi:hypothetical protein
MHRFTDMNIIFDIFIFRVDLIYILLIVQRGFQETIQLLKKKAFNFELLLFKAKIENFLVLIQNSLYFFMNAN